MLSFKPLLRYLIHESTLSRLIAKSWPGSTRPSHEGHTTYGQRTDSGATRLPSDDGESQREILRGHEICVEYSGDSNEAFGMSSIASVANRK